MKLVIVILEKIAFTLFCGSIVLSQILPFNLSVILNLILLFLSAVLSVFSVYFKSSVLHERKFLRILYLVFLNLLPIIQIALDIILKKYDMNPLWI